MGVFFVYIMFICIIVILKVNKGHTIKLRNIKPQRTARMPQRMEKDASMATLLMDTVDSSDWGPWVLTVNGPPLHSMTTLSEQIC